MASWGEGKMVWGLRCWGGRSSSISKRSRPDTEGGATDSWDGGGTRGLWVPLVKRAGRDGRFTEKGINESLPLQPSLDPAAPLMVARGEEGEVHSL